MAKRPNPSQRAAIKRSHSPSASPARTLYLIGYNLASAAAWGFVLFLGMNQVWPALQYALDGFAVNRHKGVGRAVREVGEMVVLKARGTFAKSVASSGTEEDLLLTLLELSQPR